jgi:hypothetical protein
MPDLHDETELAAGNAASRVSDHQQRHHSPHSNGTGDRERDRNGSTNSNGDPSPSHKDRKASESDPPKKKRKVNHGRSANQSEPTACSWLTISHSMCLLPSFGMNSFCFSYDLTCFTESRFDCYPRCRVHDGLTRVFVAVHSI